jgi:hypothetical protein
VIANWLVGSLVDHDAQYCALTHSLTHSPVPFWLQHGSRYENTININSLGIDANTDAG